MDYLDIIKKPMDLRTCRKNLGVKGKYKRYRNFFKGLLKIWDNSKLYNKPGTRLHKNAEILERFSRKLITSFKKEVKMKKRGGKDDSTM